MKFCIPVKENKGLSSPVSEHFGSAPIFLIVDTGSKECKVINNSNQHHAHGMCQPISVIANEKFDGLIVGGIGAGAINKLKASGIKVLKTSATDVSAVLEAYKNNELEELDAKNACQGHSCH